MIDRDGADIIFVTGAPGSKWSAIAHALMYADEINRSDLSLRRSHEKERRALHFGNYFGPGMEFGEGFIDLAAIGKDGLLAEFAEPYREAGGTKLLKSHFFARHLPFLAESFPRARFLLVHRPDERCLEWWQRAGGFSIAFPDYSWYGNLPRMREQIALENAAILDFAATRGARLTRKRSMKPLLAALGLTYTRPTLEQVANLEFERRVGLGLTGALAIEKACHAMAGLAATAVV